MESSRIYCRNQFIEYSSSNSFYPHCLSYRSDTMGMYCKHTWIEFCIVMRRNTERMTIQLFWIINLSLVLLFCYVWCCVLYSKSLVFYFVFLVARCENNSMVSLIVLAIVCERDSKADFYAADLFSLCYHLLLMLCHSI